jgi:hypothetical protein
MAKQAIIRLTVTVSYDLNGESVEAMKQRLGKVADLAAGEGFFTGETEAEVTEWDSSTEVLAVPEDK